MSVGLRHDQCSSLPYPPSNSLGRQSFLSLLAIMSTSCLLKQQRPPSEGPCQPNPRICVSSQIFMMLSQQQSQAVLDSLSVPTANQEASG